MSDKENAMRNLDALRIVASCAIVVMHYADYADTHAFGRFLIAHTRHFNLFVDLFFVVSGFAIASQYLSRVDDRASMSRFLWRRLARIYPLHIATLAFYVVIALAFHLRLVSVDNPARYALSDLPAQFLLLHAVVGEHLTFNFPSWSLSAEMFCYLAFPFIAFVALRRPSFVLLLALGLAIANSVFALASGSAFWTDWINHGGAFRALPAFHLGVALLLYRHRIGNWRVPPGLLVSSLVAFMAFGSLLPDPLVLTAIYLIPVLAVQCDASRTPTTLTHLGLDHWAHLTYSTYMLHMPVATAVITFGERMLAPMLPDAKLWLIPIAAIVLVPVSVASYRLFETPLRHALNAGFDRRRAGRAPLAAPAQPGSLR